MQGKQSLTPKQIDRILAALASDDIPSWKDLAGRFGVARCTIWRVKRDAARANPKS